MLHAPRAIGVKLLVALVVALACALTAGSASATTMILEPAGEFTMASNGPVTYSGEGIEITCNLTIRGTLERAISPIETAGAHLGHVGGETWSECFETIVTGALRLPWPIEIVRVLGTVPNNVTGILYSFFTDTIAFTLMGVLCLYIGTTEMLWSFSGSPPRSVLVRNLGTFYRRASGSSPPCPQTVSRIGEFTVSPTQTASFR
jgi:hypothetical protein